MSDFNPGDKATVVLDGRVCHVFTVDLVRGNMVCGSHNETHVSRVRPWQPGDDEEAQRWADQDMCKWFDRWRGLSAEDAAAVAAVVRKYLPKLDEEEPI